MGLEDLVGAGKYIDDLDSDWPLVGDSRTKGDDHLRGIKNVLKLSFPNISGAVTASDVELSLLDGKTSLSDPFGAVLGNASGNTTIDLDVNDRMYFPSITGDIDITFTNAAAGKEFSMSISSASSKVITYNGIDHHVSMPASTGTVTVTYATMLFYDATNAVGMWQKVVA